MTLVPRKYGRLKTTSYSSPWKQDRNSDDVVCLVLLPRQSKWRISSTLATTTKPIYLSVFAPLILLIVIIVRLTSATKHHYNPSVSLDSKTPWIPIEYLSNYTFNSDLNGCSADISPTAVNQNNCRSTRNKQCLLPGIDIRYLNGADDRRRFCDMKSSRRRTDLASIRFKFCHEYSLATVLSNWTADLVVYGTHSKCMSVLEELSLVEATIRHVICEFDHVLKRYDCQKKYSVKWTCKNCQNAYNSWVCSMFLPFYFNGNLLKPCRDICTLVEQQCPYFLPVDKRRYAGEPSFSCIDPNIPDTPEVAEYSSYSKQGSCYKPCHLRMKKSGVFDADCEPPKIDKIFSSNSPSSHISSISSTTKHQQSVLQSHSKSKHSSKTESNSKKTSISFSVLLPSSSSTSSAKKTCKSPTTFGHLYLLALLPLVVTATFFQSYCTECIGLLSRNRRTSRRKRLKILDHSIRPT